MKIVMATGGSGGHIFPALQTALLLKARGHTVVFAGALQQARSRLEQAGFACQQIDAQGLHGKSPAAAFKFASSAASACGRARRWLKEVRPHRVIGFGGYGSFAVVLAARSLGHPVILHEQNVVPGKANRALAPLASTIAVSFSQSVSFFKRSKSVWTGCPCHDQPSPRSREEICRRYGLPAGRRVVALLGGSQGSQRLSQVFFEAMDGLCREDIAAVHMTGPAQFGEYAERYAQAGIPAFVSGFISPVEDVYSIADLIVARAGAATVTELASFGVPSVLVPYPFAGGHQTHNARILSDVGAAILLEQDQLSADTLVAAIRRGLSEEYSRDLISAKTQGVLRRQAARRLADVVEKHS